MARLVVTVCVAAFAVLGTACAPVWDHRYEAKPAPVRVSAAAVTGDWEGWLGSRISLRSGGRAEVTLLDGQEWGFDDGWRMTGSGRWRIEKATGDDADGRRRDEIHMTITAESFVMRRESPPMPDQDPFAKPPKTYEWVIDVAKKDGELNLYFLTGDPDVRDYYVLRPSRERTGGV